jgi:ankyrin repeat protein
MMAAIRPRPSACARTARVWLAMVLLLAGGAANARIMSPESQLLDAAESGNSAGLDLALSRNADVDARDDGGRTALIIAAERGHLAIVRTLLAARADVNGLDKRRYDALTQAAARGDRVMVDMLLAAGADVRLVTSPYQGTALIAAAHHGHVEVVRALLARKPPIDHVNNLGWTAVMEAIVLGDGGPRHTETLRLLVAAGADVNIPDRQGITPLGQARRRGYAEMARLLEAAGGRP